MKAYVILEKQLLVFYAFKSGNTSLASWVYSVIQPRREPKGITIKSKRDYLLLPNNAVPLSLACDLKLNHGFKTVIVVRNPYSRAVSAYVNKFVLDGKRWIQAADKYETFVKRFVGSRFTSGISFREFLTELRQRQQPDSSIRVNPHFDAQLPLVCRTPNFFDDILRLEHIGVEFPQFLLKYGFPQVAFPRLRATPPAASQGREGLLDDESNFNLARQFVLPTKKNLLSASTRNLICDLYERDFVAFGYSKE
jgi:hypothetical protein